MSLSSWLLRSPLTDVDETVGLILWSSTELMVTILTATIPCLRPLYNQIRGRSRDDSYDNPNRMRTRTYRLKNIGVDKETSSNRQLSLGPHSDYSKTMVVGGKQDDQSDKSILERGEGTITRTNVVSVQVDYDEEAQWKNKKGRWSAAREAL